MTMNLAARLQARGRQLALLAAARVRRRVAQRWDSLGRIDETRDGVRLSGPGLARRRSGAPGQLADPLLLWPGDE